MSATAPRSPSAAQGSGIDRDTADRLSAAKLWLISTDSPSTCGDLPYLSSALYALTPVATTRVTAMTVDEHWRLYVNPGWVAVTDVPVIAARLAHLVWHLLADHADRARDLDVRPRQASQWAAAADATIAEVLDSPALTTGLTPPKRLGWPAGKSTEEYFARSSKLEVEHEPTLDGPDPADPDSDASDDASCGSACDGHIRSYDLPPHHDQAGLDSHDADAIRRTVAIEFKEHITQHGTIPGEWSRWVQQVLEPVVPWQQVLAAAVRRGIGWTHGHTDYTYTRISRRQAGAGRIVLPALRRPVPEVAVVVDTSGSIDDGLLAQALGEVDGILTTQAIPDGSITVLAVDAAVHHVDRVRNARDVKLGGGGGTDMGVGITAALALRPAPNVIIVLTDGYTPWPAHVPAAAVIVVLIGRDRTELPPTPPWAQRVECLP
jgi:predicted metal-dependent peptidase